MENHKKLFCSDGVRIPTKKTLSSNVPDWPQPQGVYSEGGFFHTLKFLQTVRDIWTSLDDTEMYGSELNVEYDSFVKFFKARQLVIPDEHDKSRHIVLFKLHGLLDQLLGSLLLLQLCGHLLLLSLELLLVVSVQFNVFSERDRGLKLVRIGVRRLGLSKLLDLSRTELEVLL